MLLRRCIVLACRRQHCRQYNIRCVKPALSSACCAPTGLARRICTGTSAVVGAVKYTSAVSSASGVAGDTDVSSNRSGSDSSSGAGSIYHQPQLYDDAFSFRDFESEVDFLLDAFKAHCPGAPLRTAIEMGCGPANHSMRLAKRGVQVWGVDNNAIMLEYAEAKAKAFGADVSFVAGDMRDFSIQTLPGSGADLVFCLLGTLSHMLSNADAAAALSAAARHLRPGGLLLLELAHPGDLFDGTLLLGGGGDELWEVEGRSGKLSVTWGNEMDVFDAATQVLHRTVAISSMEGEEVAEVLAEEVVPYRQFTVQEVDLLASASGLQVLELYGEMALGVGLTHEDAYRMVVALRRL